MSDLSEMLGVLAHEMRTPIAAILGYQELLSEGIYGTVDERGKEPLDRIAHSARQLLHLIDGVQEISSPDAKRLTQVEPFHPSAVLRACLVNAQADATGRGIELRTEIPERLPEVVADLDRFSRAVDLALAAAIKASHGSTLVFSARSSGSLITAKIEGTGLDVERDHPGIGQNGGTLTGAGLRLAIVQQIARQMHGDLELTPSGASTTVVLHFNAA